MDVCMISFFFFFLFGLFHFISWNGSKIVWLFNKFLYIFSFNFQTSMTSKFGLLKRNLLSFIFLFFDTFVQNWVIDLSSEIFFVLLCWPWLECLLLVCLYLTFDLTSVFELFLFIQIVSSVQTNLLEWKKN